MMAAAVVARREGTQPPPSLYVEWEFMLSIWKINHLENKDTWNPTEVISCSRSQKQGWARSLSTKGKTRSFQGRFKWIRAWHSQAHARCWLDIKYLSVFWSLPCIHVHIMYSHSQETKAWQLTSPILKNGVLDQGSVNRGPWTRSTPPPPHPRFCKVLLEHGYFPGSVYCLWLLSCSSSGVEWF